MQTRIVICGSGFAGLGMAIRLKQAGIHDFIVLERASEVGGTWRDNHYPGAACDIESHLYSFRSSPIRAGLGSTRRKKRSWIILSTAQTSTTSVRTFALAARYKVPGTMNRVRWEVSVPTVKTSLVSSFITACGGLSKPATPDIAGLSFLAGKMFHSARWDHSVSLSGKRVAGDRNRSQCHSDRTVDRPQVAQLAVFQRTPRGLCPNVIMR